MDYPSTSFDHCYFETVKQNNGKERTNMPNGEKVRTIQRLRKIIDDLNRLTEEHFMLVVSSEIPDKHFSFYGSKYLVRSAVGSNLQEKLLEEEDFDRQPIYLPVVQISGNEDEENCSENALWGKVVNLLDLYNYPAKEHFSYKQRAGHQPKTRPKPSYWPREIKYISLVNSTVQNALEEDFAESFSNKKQIIRKVLKNVQAHYRTFEKDLRGGSCTETSLNKQTVARKRGHYESYPEDHDRVGHESVAPPTSSSRQYPTDNSLRGGENGEQAAACKEDNPDGTFDSAGYSNPEQEGFRDPKRDEKQPPQQPQLVKTVLVQTATGPVLRKYVYKLRRK